MSTLFIPIGLPGCGKSTFADGLDAVVISSDSIREELYGDESIQGDPKSVFSLMKERTLGYLSSGYNVVYDATNINRWAREQITDLVDGSVEIIYIDFKVSVDVCMQRQAQRQRQVPRDVVERIASRYEPVTPDELKGNQIILIGKEDEK